MDAYLRQIADKTGIANLGMIQNPGRNLLACGEACGDACSGFVVVISCGVDIWCRYAETQKYAS